MIYLPGILTWLGALCFAYFNYLSIRGMINTYKWHFSQWMSIALFCSAAFLTGQLSTSFHIFGEMAGLMAIGISIYVYSLHYMLRVK